MAFKCCVILLVVSVVILRVYSNLSSFISSSYTTRKCLSTAWTSGCLTVAVFVTLVDFNWMSNSKNQNPCVVAAYLQGACNGGQFTVDPLPNGTHYTGPYGDEQNECQCSSVTYNTVSACGLCQNHTIVSWSSWDTNCTTVYPGVFPPGIPDGTAVPQWAFQDVTTSGLFNVTLAQSTGDNPESTASHAQSTGSAGATATAASASLTPAPTSSASSGSKTNTGAIAGGVVGGVVGLALIAGAAIFFLRKRRSQIPLSDQSGAGVLSPSSGFSDTVPFNAQMAQPRLYDPSDPSTFPTSPATATTGLSSSQGATNYSSYSVPPGGHYSGVPEI